MVYKAVPSPAMAAKGKREPAFFMQTVYPVFPKTAPCFSASQKKLSNGLQRFTEHRRFFRGQGAENRLYHLMM